MRSHVGVAVLVVIAGALVGCGTTEGTDPVDLIRAADGGEPRVDGGTDTGTDAEMTAPSGDTGETPTPGGDAGMPDAAGESDAGMPVDTGPDPAICGDGAIEAGEACDDGARRAGDGCSADCQIETAYACSGEPSACAPAPSPGSGDGMCEPTYGADVYDAFPGNHGGYPRGPADMYGWVGEDFESYADDELVETSSNKGRRSHLNVTSGSLYARHINGSQLYKRGWTTTYNFRVLSRPVSGGDLVRLTDVTPAVRVHFRDWQSTASATSGAHVFARYQTENDLYVASLRYDNKVTIKIKHCDKYTTLASANFSQGEVKTGTWYNLRFEVVGQILRFWVDGNLELEAVDDTLSWGTTGVRTDHVDVYFDNWEHR